MLALVAIAIVSATPDPVKRRQRHRSFSAPWQGFGGVHHPAVAGRPGRPLADRAVSVELSLVLVALALSITGRQSRGIRELLPAGITIGTLEAGGIIVFLALQRGPISSASVLLSLYPVTTVLLATFVLGERMSRPQLAGVALALISVILISAP